MLRPDVAGAGRLAVAACSSFVADGVRMELLAGKTIIITGASSGIGRAAATLFAANGAAVVLAARRGTALEQLAGQIADAGGRAVWLAGDVCQESFAKALVALAMDSCGRLDAAFNNAGTMGPLGPTTALERADWQRTLDTNLTAMFLAAKYQVPALLRGGAGSLIFTSTFVGHTAGFAGAAAYAASKSGIIGLTQALASEFGPQGLRVNALLPGGTDTPMAHEMNGSPEALAQVARMHALKRIAEPRELAAAAMFLASDQSSFMTGAAMLVDGGVSIHRG